MYDIYLFRPPKAIESLRNTLAPQGIEISAENGQSAGYLGLNLDFLEVTAIMFLLRQQGLTGMEVPIKYRDDEPKISKEKALKIADPLLWEEVRGNNPEFHFAPPFLASKQPMWYVVIIKSAFIPEAWSHSFQCFCRCFGWTFLGKGGNGGILQTISRKMDVFTF
jgi:hypothetical protein